MKDEIAAVKGKSKSSGNKAPLLPLPGINIAFASTGLHKVSNLLRSLFRTPLTDHHLQ